MNDADGSLKIISQLSRRKKLAGEIQSALHIKGRLVQVKLHIIVGNVFKHINYYR